MCRVSSCGLAAQTPLTSMSQCKTYVRVHNPCYNERGASACGVLEKNDDPVFGIHFIFERNASQSCMSLLGHREDPFKVSMSRQLT